MRLRAWRPGILAVSFTVFASPSPLPAGPPRPVSYSTATLARQAALDRAGFSPGIIDGIEGPRTRRALRAFQRSRGLATTGGFDPAVLAALGVDAQLATASYRITPEDLGLIGPVPKDWNAKAALRRLPYPSMTELLMERGHCTRGLLARLNPGLALDGLKSGEAVTLPNVRAAERPPVASAVEVDLGAKTVSATDAAGRVVAAFHCSVAKDPARFPRGSAKIAAIAHNPDYTFDPRMWPEVKDVRRKLTIPPGPRNPVGLCWIGMNLPGYGIHGTPAPELIGKTGSHGCIRLANWDVLRLSEMVRIGTPVRFLRS